jgi:hypothetical protein
MKNKIGKSLGKIGNILTGITILSTISKLQSLNDVLQFIKGLGLELEEIFKFFGRVVHIIVGPWDYLVNNFFSLMPWEIPVEWQNYTILFSLSFNYPIQVFIKRFMRFSHSISMKKLNRLLAYYYKIDSIELGQNYKISKKIIWDSIKDHNLFIIGPISEYLIISRSEISEEMKKKFILSAEKYLSDLNKLFMKEINSESKLQKWSKRFFYTSFIILCLFVIDKLRLGFSFDFLIYAFKGLAIIGLAIVISILSVVILSITVLMIISLFHKISFKVFPKRAEKLFSRLFKNNWSGIQNEKDEEFPKNMGINIYGEKITDLETYVNQLGNDKFKYDESKLIIYEK